MENNNRIVLSIAMVAIIAVAAIGVGYAYTAMTTNSGNNASTEYITLVQGGEGAYTFSNAQSIYWNTEDKEQASKYVTTFTLTNATIDLPSDGTIDSKTYKAVQIGKSFTIMASQTGGTATTINGIITATAFNKQVDGLEIFIGITPDGGSETYYKLIDDNTFIKWDGSAWSDNSFTINYESSAFKNLNVKLYYAAPAEGITVEHEKGAPPTGPVQQIITDGTLGFKVFNDKANGSTQSITAIALADSVTVGESIATATATTVPDTGVIVKWSSSNVSVATINESTGAVTGVAAGKTLIIATAADSGYTFVKMLTVTES